MLNKLKNFHKWASTDTNPGMTRFLTKFIMPPAICFFGYFSVDFYLLSKSELQDFEKHKITIENVIFKKRSNNKPVETIYTDLLIYPRDSEIRFAYSNLSLEEEILFRNLKINDTLTVYNESKRAKPYAPNFHPIVYLEKNSHILISFNEIKTHWKKTSMLTGAFSILFFIWYLNRMYRYKKYGRL